MVTGSVDAANYVGSDQCFSCHTDQFNDWQSSGHPWKIRKAEKARYAKLPLPPGYSWDEISYVIGGANKKARFIDLEGYIITQAKDGSEAKPSTISKTAPGPSITKERKNPINADRAI
jgi:hypothetical protein